MKTIVVDDEPLAVNSLVNKLNRLYLNMNAVGFTEVSLAIKYLSYHQVDIAFLDIEMAECDGIELAKKCKALCPNINIIFVTGYSEYTMDALKLHASGYIMKPVRDNDLKTELENLRYPIIKKITHIVEIQTFGNFEIFVNKKPLSFPRTKCKECLAYLVDRKGAGITTRELAAILWEDRPYDRALQNNTHRIISDMMKTLKDVEIEDIIIKTRRELAIDIEKVECDYFKLLANDFTQTDTFQGEYMTNYSWAIYTLAELEKRVKKIKVEEI